MSRAILSRGEQKDLYTLQAKDINKSPLEINFEGKTYLLLNEEDYKEMLEVVNEGRKIKIHSILEEEILEANPHDIYDVWVVAKEYIKSIPLHLVSQKDIKRIIKRIKQEHPNLFRSDASEFMDIFSDADALDDRF